jgi:GNAT superfamily N-acetyltransferase
MIAVEVTYLERHSPPSGTPLPSPSLQAAIQTERLDSDAYLSLYRRVAAPWGWDQRLKISAAMLANLLVDPATVIFVLRMKGEAIGFAEFNGADGPDVELKYFGLVPEAQGQRLGPWLLDFAQRAVWSPATRRIWLHTETNDHPKALAIYIRAGFSIYDRRVETSND